MAEDVLHLTRLEIYDQFYAEADPDVRFSLDAKKQRLIDSIPNMGEKSAKELLVALLTFEVHL